MMISKFIQQDFFGVWSQIFFVVISSRPNNGNNELLSGMLSTFAECAGNRMLIDSLLSTHALIESIFNVIVLNPQRIYNTIIFPEIASLCCNLSGIESFEHTEKLIDIGMIKVLFTMLAKFSSISLSTTSYCLDALFNLMEFWQDESIQDKIKHQCCEFTFGNQTGMDILDNLTVGNNEYITEKATELLMYYFDIFGDQDEFRLDERDELEY